MRKIAQAPFIISIIVKEKQDFIENQKEKYKLPMTKKSRLGKEIARKHKEHFVTIWDSCQFVKLHHPSSNPIASKQVSNPFELIHYDIWGLRTV